MIDTLVVLGEDRADKFGSVGMSRMSGEVGLIGVTGRACVLYQFRTMRC